MKPDEFLQIAVTREDRNTEDEIVKKDDNNNIHKKIRPIPKTLQTIS